MRTTLVLFAAFVTVSLLLWNGCLGSRASVVGGVPAPMTATVHAGR